MPVTERESAARREGRRLCARRVAEPCTRAQSRRGDRCWRLTPRSTVRAGSCAAVPVPAAAPRHRRAAQLNPSSRACRGMRGAQRRAGTTGPRPWPCRTRAAGRRQDSAPRRRDIHIQSFRPPADFIRARTNGIGPPGPPVATHNLFSSYGRFSSENQVRLRSDPSIGMERSFAKPSLRNSSRRNGVVVAAAAPAAAACGALHSCASQGPPETAAAEPFSPRGR